MSTSGGRPVAGAHALEPSGKVGLTPLVLDADHGLAAEQNLLVAVWAGEPNTAHLAEAVTSMERLHRQYPGRVLMFNVIAESAGMPNGATREALRVQFEQMRGKLAAAAVVVEHRGVLHSLSRAIVTSIVTLAKKPFPLKVFGERSLGADWLTKNQTGPTAETVTELAQRLELGVRERRGLPR